MINTKDFSKIELKQPGEKVTMCVLQCRKFPAGKYPEMEFAGELSTGDRVSVLMPYSSGKTRLKRLNLDVPDANEHYPNVAGMYLTIMRSENKSQPEKPFWEVHLAKEGEYESGASPAAPPVRSQSAGPGAPSQQRNGEPMASQSPEEAEYVAQRHAEGEKAKREKMSELRRIFHGIWEAEANFQLETAAKINAAHPEWPALEVTGESVNASTASLFIEYNRKNLL